MFLEINDEDLKMLKNEFGYVRCLYWDGKLEINNNHCKCDNCHDCEKPYLIENWIKDRLINLKK